MSVMDSLTAQALVEALLRIEQARHPLLDRHHLAHVLQQVAQELATVGHATSVTLTVQAALFDPPLPLEVSFGPNPADALDAHVVDLQWAGLSLGTLRLTPPPPDRTTSMLPLLERVARESIAEVYEAERLVQTATLQMRQQLAREVHEEVKQVLPAIRLFAEQAERQITTHPAQAASLMRDVRESAQHGLDALTLWIGAMQQPAPDGTLQDTLERLVVQIERMQPDLVVTSELAPPPLSCTIGTCVLGIVRNALMNVVQHAEASQVTVRVVAQAGGVAIHIHDDGIGCEPQAALAAPGIGLNSLLERVRELHGHAHLTAAPGAGLALEAWLPGDAG